MTQGARGVCITMTLIFDVKSGEIELLHRLAERICYLLAVYLDIYIPAQLVSLSSIKPQALLIWCAVACGSREI